MKRLLNICLCVVMMAITPFVALAAPNWPDDIGIEAEGGIVIDADTGTVLYGKAIHGQFYPASITKIMTALLIIENCDLDEMVEFSSNAVYNVESNSTNAGISPGESMTVRECLYALMLKSANEAGNALAEHMSGDTETFAKKMTEKAAALGCKNTNFANPSGLNDENNYTSPYDMAMISRAAFENPTFVEIVSTRSYRLPPTQKDPEGLVISSNHRMTKEDDEMYYPGIIGGKTGYTSLTGNTLVTCVEKDGMKLISVVLKGTRPQYWLDSKALLDFGYENFKSVEIATEDTAYVSGTSRLNIQGLGEEQAQGLELAPEYKVTLPKNAKLSDAAVKVSYDLNDSDPNQAVAKLSYTYNERAIGTGYLWVKGQVANNQNPNQTSKNLETSSTGSTVEPEDQNVQKKNTGLGEEQKKGLIKIATVLGIVLLAAALIGTVIFLRIRAVKREEELRRLRRERRQQRISEEGMTAEYQAMLEKRRSGTKDLK